MSSAASVRTSLREVFRSINALPDAEKVRVRDEAKRLVANAHARARENAAMMDSQKNSSTPPDSTANMINAAPRTGDSSMQNESSNAGEQRRPDGWPSWLWALVRLFVKPEHRTELMKPEQRAKTARALANNLLRARKDAKEWRDRALAVEKLYCDQCRSMREAAQAHSGLSWRI